MTPEEAMETLRGGLWQTIGMCRFESIRGQGEEHLDVLGAESGAQY